MNWNEVSTDGLVYINERPPLPDRLKRRREELARDLAQVDQTIKILEENPDMARILDTIQRHNIY